MLLNKMTKEQILEVANSTPQGNSTGFIFESGVYPIKIKWVEVAKARNSEAQSFNIRYERNGVESTIFGPYITNKDGQQNKIGFDKLLELQAVCGVNELNTVSKQVTTKTETYTAEVIKELSNKEVYIQTILEYGKYNDTITRRMKLVGFYRKSDLASITEIAGNGEPGDRYKFVTMGDKPRCKEIRYLDGVTEEEAKAWEEKRRQAAKAQANTTTAASESGTFPVEDEGELPF